MILLYTQYLGNAVINGCNIFHVTFGTSSISHLSKLKPAHCWILSWYWSFVQ